MSYHPTQRAKRATSKFSHRVVVVFLILFAVRAHGQQIHQLFYNDSYWADANLNGSVTDQYSSIASFITTPDNDLHVYYRASDDHLHQLYNLGAGWTDEDLTAETGAVPSLSNSSISGFSVKNWQYVFYVGADHHVHMLLFTDHWFDTDLTRTGNGDPCRGTLVAFLTSPNNDLHVYYTQIEGDIEQLYNGGSGWQNEDLTEEVGGNSSGGGEIAGFSVGNSQYVYYTDANNDLNELYFYNGVWSYEDLTALTNTVPPAFPYEPLTALAVPGTKKMRIYYTGMNNHVIQLASTNNKRWTSADLTKKTKGPQANPSNGIVGFVTTPNNQIHVYYVSASQHLNQLFLPSPSKKWQNEDLTAESEGDSVVSTLGIAGFSIGNLQYVYYMGN